MTRITYTESNGVLISKPVVGNGNLLVVELDPSNLRYKVVNEGRDHTFDSGQAASLTELKKQAKKALLGLGVSFVPEVRNTKNKVA